ncbi:MAG: hypothetical protein ACTSYI_09310 [Promethearchaeota archaeon]
MSQSQIDFETAGPSYIKRNYHLLRHYLLFLIDIGLDFLKQEYIRHNSENSFAEFTAHNYYDYILKDYVRRKLKSQLRSILNTSVYALPFYKNHRIDQNQLDELVKKYYPEYAENDMTLLHTSSSSGHPTRIELETISKLTFRVAIIQTTRVISCDTENIDHYSDLIRAVYPEIQQSRTSLKALLSMVDQMIDCFEHAADLISIPFYKPTWNLRDFGYMRKIYEFALQETNRQIEKIYGENKIDRGDKL